MADKFPMQADGAGTKMNKADENGELSARRGLRGESQGGAYPNPNSGEDADPERDETFSGGQSKGKGNESPVD